MVHERNRVILYYLWFIMTRMTFKKALNCLLHLFFKMINIATDWLWSLLYIMLHHLKWRNKLMHVVMSASLYVWGSCDEIFFNFPQHKKEKKKKTQRKNKNHKSLHCKQCWQGVWSEFLIYDSAELKHWNRTHHKRPNFGHNSVFTTCIVSVFCLFRAVWNIQVIH